MAPTPVEPLFHNVKRILLQKNASIKAKGQHKKALKVYSSSHMYNDIINLVTWQRFRQNCSKRSSTYFCSKDLKMAKFHRNIQIGQFH